MKTGIHPTLHQGKISCACGATYVIRGTLAELHTEICMSCHPIYTGKKKLLDTEGRVDKFMSKFKAANDNAPVEKAAAKKSKKAA